jgi:hypothetical protein
LAVAVAADLAAVGLVDSVAGARAVAEPVEAGSCSFAVKSRWSAKRYRPAIPDFDGQGTRLSICEQSRRKSEAKE